MKDMYGVDFIQRDNVEFSDEEVFGDKDVHEFNCDCYDGIAFCYEPNTSKVLPDLVVEYPKREDVMQNRMLCDYILKYCGLYDLDYKDINYGDIMLALGKINKVPKL